MVSTVGADAQDTVISRRLSVPLSVSCFLYSPSACLHQMSREGTQFLTVVAFGEGKERQGLERRLNLWAVGISATGMCGFSEKAKETKNKKTKKTIACIVLSLYARRWCRCWNLTEKKADRSLPYESGLVIREVTPREWRGRVTQPQRSACCLLLESPLAPSLMWTLS